MNSLPTPNLPQIERFDSISTIHSDRMSLFDKNNSNINKYKNSPTTTTQEFSSPSSSLSSSTMELESKLKLTIPSTTSSSPLPPTLQQTSSSFPTDNQPQSAPIMVTKNNNNNCETQFELLDQKSFIKSGLRLASASVNAGNTRHRSVSFKKPQIVVPRSNEGYHNLAYDDNEDVDVDIDGDNNYNYNYEDQELNLVNIDRDDNDPQPHLVASSSFDTDSQHHPLMAHTSSLGSNKSSTNHNKKFQTTISYYPPPDLDRIFNTDYRPDSQYQYDDLKQTATTTTSTGNNNVNENNKLSLEEEMKKWDRFITLPPPDDDETVDSEWVKISIQWLKVGAYIFTFVIVLCFAVLSKCITLLMTSMIRIDHKVLICNQEEKFIVHPLLEHDKMYSAQYPADNEDRIAWLWSLYFATIAPYVFALGRALRMCFFKSTNICSWSTLFTVSMICILFSCLG